MDQAKTWEALKDACTYGNIPAENIVWADTKGNIGWQAVGITPVRQNFSGSVPVLGEGSHDWDKIFKINSPGQSENSGSKYYDNLFALWAKNEYFPAFYSKDKIEKVTDNTLISVPTSH